MRKLPGPWPKTRRGSKATKVPRRRIRRRLEAENRGETAGFQSAERGLQSADSMRTYFSRYKGIRWSKGLRGKDRRSPRLLQEGLNQIHMSVPVGGLHPGPVPTQQSQAGTVLFDAVYLTADEELKGEVGRKAIVVITDGVDTGRSARFTELDGPSSLGYNTIAAPRTVSLTSGNLAIEAGQLLFAVPAHSAMLIKLPPLAAEVDPPPDRRAGSCGRGLGDATSGRARCPGFVGMSAGTGARS